MVNLTTINNALKVLYVEPIRNDIRLKSDAMISRVIQDTTKIVGSQKIVRAAQVGVNGGVGAGTETGDLPSAAENLYEQIESTTKNLYGSIEISDKTMKGVTGSNAGSFIDALDREMKGVLKTARWNFARQAYGDGNGKLMTCKANAASSAIVEAASGDSVRFLLPGLAVDLRKAADNTVYTGMNGLRIKDVDYKTNKITLSSATTITTGDYLTIQSSYGLELTGLGKIMEAPVDGQTIYGKVRADHSWLRPYLDSAFGAINEDKLDTVINTIEDHWNVRLDFLGFGNDAYKFYKQLMDQRRAINDVMILEGGHRALKFNGMTLVRNPNLQDDEINIVDTSLFTVDMIDDWDWIDGTQGVLVQVPNKPVYKASFTKYCDLMCALPAGLAKLTGVLRPV